MCIRLKISQKAFITLALCLLFFSGLVFAQNWYETAETVPYQPHVNIMQYGWSVSIDGDFAVVSSHGTDDYAGAAYVLHRAGDDWETLAKLTASDGAPDQYFGRCVSISGSAYVFAMHDSGWKDLTETQKLTASDAYANDLFGKGIAVSGTTILAGAPSSLTEEYASTGSAYFFTHDANVAISSRRMPSLAVSPNTFEALRRLDGRRCNFGFSGALHLPVSTIPGHQ